MSALQEVDLGPAFGPFLAIQDSFGFVPNLFRAQTLLPRAIEAEVRIAGTVLLKQVALPRLTKERILLSIAAQRRNVYCVTAHANMLRSLGTPAREVEQIVERCGGADLPEAERGLLEFSSLLSQRPTAIGPQDIDRLRQLGYADEAILEAVVVTALTEFLCTLSTGLEPRPDFEPWRIRAAEAASQRHAILAGPMAAAARAREGARPYLRGVDLDTFPPFVFFRDRFGFVPNIFRAQSLRPDVIEAEAQAVRDILLSDDVLPRVRKEYILLVLSAANLNTYCVAVHCEMLRNLGIPEERSDQIALDHRLAGLAAADTALLDFALKLGRRPFEFGRADIETLRRAGFTDAQILEAVVMTALTNFLNTLQMGLGTLPDFEPRLIFAPGPQTDLSAAPASLMEGDRARPTAAPAEGDADAELVARVQEGEVDAYETLVRRHERRIYRVLLGVTGNAEDSEDGVQNTFLKAFRHIGEFQGTSRFTTWLTRIAINEGLKRRHGRKNTLSLEDAGPEDWREARPRLVQSWESDPEELYSRAELRELVEREILDLPARYRLVVMLRDIEQLSTQEAAAALGLGVPTLKTRLLRGRLMLREALARHFSGGGRSKPRA